MVIDDLYFKTKPWPHQLEALKFLMTRDFGGLFTDPGTGKSKVFIDLMVNRRFERIVITSTKKPCETWLKQIKTHANANAFHVISLLDIPVESKVDTAQKSLLRRNKHHPERPAIIVINLDTIWMHPIGDWLCRKFKPDCVIVDESHRIKAASGAWSNYLTKIGKVVRYKYILSGTMISEDPLDAYGQFRFMAPHVFGTRVSDFKAMYHNLDPIISARCGYPVLDKHQPYKNMNDFYQKFWSHVFRIPSSVKLPKRVNVVCEYELSEKGCKAYDMIRNDGALNSKQGFLLVENALTKVIRLQQAAAGFIPLQNDEGVTSLYNTDKSRCDALESILCEFPAGEPIVIFCKFRKDIKNVHRTCKKLGLTAGELSGKEDTSDDWVKGKTQVLVVQYQSGSESIDLTRARYTVFYSLVHSYSQYFQAKKRTNRPGARRTNVYYHLAALCNGKETVDHQLIKTLRRKKNLVDEVEAGRAEL